MNKLKNLLLLGAGTIVSLGFVVIALLPQTATATEFSISVVPRKCWESSTGCNICDIVLIFTNAANIMSGSLSGVALLMFIVGGMFLIFANGNEQRIEKGKKILAGTIMGLAIVFLAWFGVNFIVRTAYFGSVNEESNPETEVSVFSSQWWTPPACYSASKKTNCESKTIGDVCGIGGDCKTTDACFCYRKDFPDDTTECSVNADSLEEVTSEASKKTKACFCTSTCALAAESLNIVASCVKEAQWKPATQSKLPYSCPNAGEVCVLPK